MSESMIIGVDHGYAAMKTAHFVPLRSGGV